MKRMLTGMVALLLAGAAQADDDSACDDDTKSPTPTVQINMCATEQYHAADRALNRRYRELLTGLDDPDDDLLKGKRAALINAQRAWVKFRDAQCEAERVLMLPGKEAPQAEMGCKITMTRERTVALEEMGQ